MISLVQDSVFRSPRPAVVAFDFIKQNFKTVLSLEGLEEDALEAQELDPTSVLSFPIGFFEIYMLGISHRRLTNILTAIDRASKPLLVHCQHGQDRTGLIVAAYRVRVCGWTKEAAFAEAKRFGYRWWLNYGLNRTWKNFQ